MSTHQQYIQPDTSYLAPQQQKGEYEEKMQDIKQFYSSVKNFLFYFLNYKTYGKYCKKKKNWKHTHQMTN